MPLIEYTSKRFSDAHLEVIDRATSIARSYRAQGYDLTLRQLYYQFVSRGLIPNKDTEYKRLGSILADARLAGLFDWDYITDRTRNVRGGDGSMTNPAQVINEYAYAMALWEGQPERVEVWVEKDALVGVIGRAAGGLRTPYFSCRGYTSLSEVWAAAQRIEGYLDEGVERVTILHLGDHDPSGIDMTRDITDRLQLFLEGDGYDPEQLTIDRIALNMPQVRQYSPPPNPAKLTDSRGTGYVQRYGSSSWELDALEPSVLADLIRNGIMSRLDTDLWEERREAEERGRSTLRTIRDRYDRVLELMAEDGIELEAVEPHEEATDDDAE